MKDTDRDLQPLEEALPPEGYQTDKITFDEGSNNLKMVQSEKSKKNNTPVFFMRNFFVRNKAQSQENLRNP